MKKTSLILILAVVLLIGLLTILYFFNEEKLSSQIPNLVTPLTEVVTIPLPTPDIKQPGTSALLPQGLQAFQTFNNCGPATLSMLLSYYQINVSQQELGLKLRPYQNPQGNNDDKSVTFEEMADEVENYDLTAFIRPNGDINLLKLFSANGIPVAVRTHLTLDDDIGHFRVVVGFDDTTGEIIQDDSYHGPKLRYSYNDFLAMWQPFNYEYMVLATDEDLAKIEALLGEDWDLKTAWQNANERARQETLQNPDNVRAQFNQVVSLYNLEQYNEAVALFEQIENRLSFRTLWYQIEPIQAYLETGNYTRVFSLTDNILSNNNLAFSQLYILRGDAYVAQGNLDAARQEYEKAVLYNQNLQLAKDKLASI